MTIKQAAERLSVSTKTISRRIQDGSIPIIRLGYKTIRIADADLERYLDKHKENSEE